MTAVVDASAVLALLNGEKGADQVAAIARQSLLSAVNFAEVLTIAVERDTDPAKAAAQVARFGFSIVDVDVDLASRAARLRTATRSLGRSLADRICLALAQSRGFPVYSADRKWALLDIGIDIRLIR